MVGDYTLAYGTHASPDDGRCAMEWVSFLAGEPHSDHPSCVSQVLRALCIALNDGLADDERQRLRPYLARTIGTAGDGLDTLRAWLALDWLVREYTPAWLAPAGLLAEAEQLRGLDQVRDRTSLRPALDRMERAGQSARRARGGGRWTAARTVARETAWSSAGAAAWSAARLCVGDQAGDDARAMARAIAGDAAAATARDALERLPHVDGRAAAMQAARDALMPTVDSLHGSLLELLERMLPTEALALPEAVPAVFTVSV